ncbi:MAG TPA: hypothetical protein PLU88_00875 [Armatimonadota bacterium]|nr:hypothetical protein [Armatimonadota bacterium]
MAILIRKMVLVMVAVLVIIATPAFSGVTEIVSLSSSGEQGNSGSHNPSLSADGRYVAFESYATNLVPDDTNGWEDIFVRDRGVPAQPKELENDVPVTVANYAVTGAFPGFFYIENIDRSSGLRVISSAEVEVGKGVLVTGVMTTVSGERAINETSVVTLSELNIKPVGMNNLWLGGGESALQQGVLGGSGLNNIGLLVRTCGKFTYIDDGSGINLKCIVPDDVTLDENWTFVAVTGISSCEMVGDELHRLLLVRSQSDITSY